MNTTDFLGMEVDSKLVRALMSRKGEIKANGFKKTTFEGIRIPEIYGQSKAILFLIEQTPLESIDMTLMFKYKGEIMRAGIFRGMLFDSRSKTAVPFYGDINDNRLTYAIEERNFSRDDLFRFLKNPESDPRPMYDLSYSGEEIYTGNYFIPKTEHFPEEKGEVKMRRLS